MAKLCVWRSCSVAGGGLVREMAWLNSFSALWLVSLLRSVTRLTHVLLGKPWTRTLRLSERYALRSAALRVEADRSRCHRLYRWFAPGVRDRTSGPSGPKP